MGRTQVAVTRCGLAAVIFLVGIAAGAPARAAALPPLSQIAIIPLAVEGGRGSAKESLPGIYKEVFEENGFQVVMGPPVENAMQQLSIRAGGLPTNKELLRIGRKLGSRYVLAANINVKTKRVWVMAVPKAKSTITIDTVIVDVKKAEVVYDPKNKVGISSQGGSDLQTGVGLVLSWPAALFMGGSRTQEERKAAGKSVRAAYADFFESLRKTQTRKIT